MACNAEAALANMEAPPVQRNHDGPLLSCLTVHYSTVAYTIVIWAYVLAIGEYLYLRLTSLIFPEKVIYHSMCEKKSSEVIGKNALHYTVIIVAFCFVALFQIICFFGLTISEKWTTCTLSGSDPTAQKKHAFAARIRSTMNATVYPTFICYIISSVIICGVIFYMIGVRDSVDEIASSISLYAFDVILLFYFLAFPIIVYTYHPFVRKSAALRIARMHRADLQSNGTTIQELRADGTLTLAADTSPPLASPEISCSPTPRDFAHPFSDRLIPQSANSDIHCSSQQFRRNVRLTTTV